MIMIVKNNVMCEEENQPHQQPQMECPRSRFDAYFKPWIEHEFYHLPPIVWRSTRLREEEGNNGRKDEEERGKCR